MTLPNTFNLIIEQGTTFKFWFAVRTTDGVIRDLIAEGYSTGRLQVRDKPASQGGTVKLSLTTANGGINMTRQYDLPEGDPNRRQWSGYLYASATATAALTDWGLGGYNFEIVKDSNAGEVITVLRGDAVLEPEWTV